MKKRILGVFSIMIFFLAAFGIIIYSDAIENLSNNQQDMGDIISSLKNRVVNSTKGALIVDANGNGDYLTIQGAVDNGNPSDTIYVWVGIYYENVVVNKTLTIIGNGSTNTHIDAIVIFLA